MDSTDPNSKLPFTALFNDWCRQVTNGVHNWVWPERHEPNMVANFEHGQWFVTDLVSGASWSCHDAETELGAEYIDFDQISHGDLDFWNRHD
jgi:hypothetical protein